MSGAIAASQYWSGRSTTGGYAAAATALPDARETPSLVIVGGGRVGRAFLKIAGPRAQLVRRGNCVGDGEGPVLVATHCSHLDEVLQQTPRRRWNDLVFLQNGMLQEWLELHNLQSNTQALLYVSAVDDACMGNEQVSIFSGGRDTLVWGRWASVVVDIMQQGGLLASEVQRHEAFLEGVVEKLLWSSIFWVLCAAFGGKPVGVIATQQRQQVHELVTELLPLAIKGASSEQFVDSMVQELCAYSMAIGSSVPSIDMAASEFELRNGWLLRQEMSPCHLFWLEQARRQSNNLNLERVMRFFGFMAETS